MKLLNTRYYGQIARCNNCGAIIGYEPADVSDNQNIKCPQCSFMLWVPFNPKYEGEIKDDGKSETNEQ